MAPCIEVVGYRQRKKGIKSFGDLSSDFGANIKFVIGKKKKYKKININNLKTIIKNKKIKQSVSGNTNTQVQNLMNAEELTSADVRKELFEGADIRTKAFDKEHEDPMLEKIKELKKKN